MLTDLELITRRYKKARAKADLWMSLLEACYHYTVPSRNLFYLTSQTAGSQKNARVYDTTAVSAVRNFVSKVQGGLCPPQQRWFLLEAGTEIPEENREEVNAALQEISDKIYHYLRRSNFDLVFNETCYDLAIGTGCLICNPGNSDDNPLEFYSVPLARVAIEESVANVLETNFRWWEEIRVADIREIWPQAVLDVVTLHLYEEDENATLKNLVEGTLYYPENPSHKRYRYVVFYENNFFVDEFMDSSPWIVFRWSKTNNEIYGRGPVIDALPSILSLNELARLELSAANFNVSKPIMAYSDGVFNPWTMKLEPNTVIPVAPNSSGQWPLQVFPDTSNPQFMQLTSNDLRQQINTLLYANPLGPIANAPTKTATELALRQRNLAEEIGPGFTRMQSECLGRILKRVMSVLEKKGLIEKIQINGKAVQVSYKSPLVVAQGEQDVQGFMSYYQIIQAVQGPENAMVNINPVRFPAWVASKLGIDPKTINTESEMEAFYASQSEKAQEQELMAMEGAIGGPQSVNPATA